MKETGAAENLKSANEEGKSMPLLFEKEDLISSASVPSQEETPGSFLGLDLEIITGTNEGELGEHCLEDVLGVKFMPWGMGMESFGAIYKDLELLREKWLGCSLSLVLVI